MQTIKLVLQLQKELCTLNCIKKTLALRNESFVDKHSGPYTFVIVENLLLLQAFYYLLDIHVFDRSDKLVNEVTKPHFVPISLVWLLIYFVLF